MITDNECRSIEGEGGHDLVDWSGRDDPSDSELCVDIAASSSLESRSKTVLPSSVPRQVTFFKEDPLPSAPRSVQRRPGTTSINDSSLLPNSSSQSFPSPPSSISTSPSSSPHLPRNVKNKSALFGTRSRRIDDSCNGSGNGTGNVLVLPKKWLGGIAVLLGMYSVSLFCLHLKSGLIANTVPVKEFQRLQRGYGNVRKRELQIGVVPKPKSAEVKVKQENTSGLTDIPRRTSNDVIAEAHRSVKVQTHPDHHFPKIPSGSKAIFYHIYLPPNNTQMALDIVKEQLKQLADANVELFYNTIGARHVLPRKIMERWCSQRKIHCHFLSHYDTGMEDITLQNVYEYCQQKSSLEGGKGDKIGYLHNKGSHHPSPINHEWRYLMTGALVRKECWKPQQCNVCGLYFTADRGHYISGNVWTADCSYVRQLISPIEFAPKLSEIVGKAFLKQLAGEFRMTQYPNSPSSFGVGRYASEVWIGSHPTIMACDFSASFEPGNGYDNTKDFLNFVNDQIDETKNTTTELVFTTDAPTHAYKLARPRMMKNLELRHPENEWKREYFLLAGFLFRWIQLYHQLPSEDSWVWTHYPHGDWWKQAVQKHGKNVLEAVLTIDVDANAR